jgi:HSP20 family protein
MDSIRTIRLRWLHGTLTDATRELAHLNLTRFSPHAWRPPINAYRSESGFRVCVDLAGVDKSLIDLTVSQQRLLIRGEREVPAPDDENDPILQMIAMEIDYGPFERGIQLPDDVDVDGIQAEQRNGLLWIHLPLRKS